MHRLSFSKRMEYTESHNHHQGKEKQHELEQRETPVFDVQRIDRVDETKAVFPDRENAGQSEGPLYPHRRDRDRRRKRRVWGLSV